MALVTRLAAGAPNAPAAGAPLLAVPVGAAELPDAKPLPAVKGIIDQFDRYRLVAIGEDHGLVPVHKLFRDLVRDPRFAAKVNDVVVEFGNARYQSLMDRFILKGEPVPIQRLRAVWRDSIGGGHLGTWDAPVYEQFFRTVRRVNQGLPSGRRLRVLLGDSPINWATATPQQVTYWPNDAIAPTRPSWSARCSPRATGPC